MRAGRRICREEGRVCTRRRGVAEKRRFIAPAARRREERRGSRPRVSPSAIPRTGAGAETQRCCDMAQTHRAARCSAFLLAGLRPAKYPATGNGIRPHIHSPLRLCVQNPFLAQEVVRVSNPEVSSRLSPYAILQLQEKGRKKGFTRRRGGAEKERRREDILALRAEEFFAPQAQKIFSSPRLRVSACKNIHFSACRSVDWVHPGMTCFSRSPANPERRPRRMLDPVRGIFL